MSKAYQLPQPQLEGLIKQLVNIEEKKDVLINEFFSSPSRERENFENFINIYIKELEKLVQNAKTNSKNNQPPFVVIGSNVQVQDLEDDEVYNFKIISPYDEKKDASSASFLSPVGKSLLLKRIGDKVDIKTPAGTLQYVIKSIEFY